MQVIIKETNVREILTLTDHKTGCDWVRDFIGNADALGSQFVWDEEKDAYVCSQEDYDWWENVIANMQALDYRIETIAKSDAKENIYEVIAYIDGNDLETYTDRVNQEIDEVFGESAGK